MTARGHAWSTTPRTLRCLAVTLCLATGAWAGAAQQAPTTPSLTEPVSDFAGVIDGPSAREIDRLSRAVQAATGDTLLVATVTSVAAFGDIRAYANDLFENHGRGIGEQDKDNGLLIVLAVEEREVWVEVGYGLEEIITDGFAGETSRQVMTPYFRQGDYGAGLLAGARRLATRIAESRGVQLDQLPLPRGTAPPTDPGFSPLALFILVVVLILLASRTTSSRRRRQVFWGGGPWSGWGGGGYGGSFGGGGGFGGGGFGGFGGGGSGGGGGGARW